MVTPINLKTTFDEIAAAYQVGELPMGPAGTARLRALPRIELVLSIAEPSRDVALRVEVDPDGGGEPSVAQTQALDALWGARAWDRMSAGDSMLTPTPAFALLAQFAVADDLLALRDLWVPTWFVRLRWAVLRARLDVHLRDVLGPSSLSETWLSRWASHSEAPLGESPRVVEAARAVVASLRTDRPDLEGLCERLEAQLLDVPLSLRPHPKPHGGPADLDRDARAAAIHHGAMAVARGWAGEADAAALSWNLCARMWHRANCPTLAEEALGYAAAASPARDDDAGGSVRGVRLVLREPAAMAAATDTTFGQGFDEALLFDVHATGQPSPVALLRVWLLHRWVQLEHVEGRSLRVVGSDRRLSRLRLPTSCGVAEGEPVVTSPRDLETLLELDEDG